MSVPALILTLTGPDGSKTLSAGEGYALTRLEGLTAADVTLTLQKCALTDGSRAAGTRIEPRVVEVEAAYVGARDKELVRGEWLHFLSPHAALTLQVQVGKIIRSTACFVSVPLRDLRGAFAEPLRFSFTLTCPDPALYGGGFHENMAGVVPMLTAPLSLFLNADAAAGAAGLTGAYKVFRERITVVNDGDLDAGLVLTFTAKGPVTNPRLDNLTTGQFIRVLCTLAQGDVLTVSTVRGRKRVELNGVNISQKKDPQSSFFQLVRGKNVLRYAADENVTNLDDVRPSCDFAWLGV